MEAVLIGLLGTALFAVIGLLATALFQLRNDVTQLRREVSAGFSSLSTEIAELRAGFDAHLEMHSQLP